MGIWKDATLAEAQQWAHKIAELVADSLVDGGCVEESKITDAKTIVFEEIYARLCVRDFPPPQRPEEEGPGRSLSQEELRSRLKDLRNRSDGQS